MLAALVWLGVGVGLVSTVLLVIGLIRPSLRIWPTPGPGSLQAFVFWPLFRGLNVLSVTVSAATAGWAGLLGLPLAIRWLALALAIAAFALFAYAFRVLGRDNSYGARDGLVTDGIYRWSRNPQNALLMIVHAAAAVAADSGAAYLVGGAMVAVYALMVFCEEPWLEAAYGEAYRDYRRRVPRFLGWPKE